MSMPLAELIARLIDAVPPIDGVPSVAQYRQAVIDSVADLGRRASMTRLALLPVVAGVAQYPAPADCLALIQLSAIGAPFGVDSGGGTWVTSAGLIPFTGSYHETVSLLGDAIVISPTPQFTADRTLAYAAADILTGESFLTLSSERAGIALLLAQAIALGIRSTAPAAQAVKVTSDGDTIDTTPQATLLRALAQTLRSDYLAAVASLNAHSGGFG